MTPLFQYSGAGAGLPYLIPTCLTMSTGELPVDWRLANIFALHKTGPKNAENYRLISLTCVCSKVMDHNRPLLQVSRLLDDHHCLLISMHFRPGRSCETVYFSCTWLVFLAWPLYSYRRCNFRLLQGVRLGSAQEVRPILYKLDHYGIRGNLNLLKCSVR